jgi:Zn-dependent M28 family amino/carboxypeptidase
MPSARAVRRVSAATLAAVSALALSVPASAAPDGRGSSGLARKLERSVTTEGVNRHLIALQRIADQHDGNRAASTTGHQASAEYIAGKVAAAGFDVTRHEFPFTYTETLAEELAVAGTEVPIIVMTYSPSTPEGGITAPLAVVPVDDTPGCEVTDFTDVTGKIALIQRGGCTFAQKQASAADAGAVGAVIYNNQPDAPLNGTLGDPTVARIPTGGITKADGEALAAQAGAATTLELRTFQEERTSYNVIAQTRTGRTDNVVMAGSHLDSVSEGPGINDNGSGSAALLEVALRMGGSPRVNNAVRFAWWSAEEYGLIGSEAYVASLTFEQQLDIALYLNFDMVGSPNAAYFAYDGDDSDGVGAGPGPFGSAQIEKSFVDYFATKDVTIEGTDFSGRSDYGGFIAVGIPSGGLFTGAEGIKTETQAAKWGGQAGIAYDPCYHQACDNLGNIDRVALGRNADAMAWVIATYGISTEDVNGVPPRAERAAHRAAARTMAATSVAGHPDDVVS